MGERLLALLAWGGSVLLLIGTFGLAQPWDRYAALLVMPWVVASVALFGSRNSTKTALELTRNVVIVAVVLGGFSYFREGRPSLDEDGYAVVDGYDATFKDRSAAAVATFAKVLFGGWLGVATGVALRPRRKENPVVVPRS